MIEMAGIQTDRPTDFEHEKREKHEKGTAARPDRFPDFFRVFRAFHVQESVRPERSSESLFSLRSSLISEPVAPLEENATWWRAGLEVGSANPAGLVENSA
jgi:hypothetical protein